MRTRRQFMNSAAMLSVLATSAFTATAGTKRQVEAVSTAQAPKAAGPYSQAVKARGVLYLSGQLARDPESNVIVSGDFAAQARRVLENLKAVLHAGGSDFDRVTKATVYLTDMANFNTLNTIYAEYFGDHRPARSTVGVAALAAGALVEIDLIAVV